MTVRFRAAAADGRIEDGVLAVSSSEAARIELRQRGLVPVELQLEADRAPRAWGWRTRTSASEAMAVWCRTVGTLTSAGVSLDRALTFAQGQAAHGDVRVAVERVTIEVRSGATLSDALRRQQAVVPDVVIALIEAGAQTGALDEALLRSAAWLEEVQTWRAQLRASLIYPALIAAVTLVATVVLLTAVVPRFTTMLEDAGVALPLSTRVLVAVSEVLRTGWWIGPTLVVAVLVSARTWLRDTAVRERWHRWRWHLPWIGALDGAVGTARFARTLGQLLEGGMPLLSAMALARGAVPNAAMARAIQRAETRVRDGLGLASALETILSPIAVQLLAAGEASGQLAAQCLRIAESSEDAVRRALRAAAALVEPLVIILFGGIVGFVALAMLQAMYGLQAAPWGRGIP